LNQLRFNVHSSSDLLAPKERSRRSVVGRSAPIPFSSCRIELIRRSILRIFSFAANHESTGGLTSKSSARALGRRRVWEIEALDSKGAVPRAVPATLVSVVRHNCWIVRKLMHGGKVHCAAAPPITSGAESSALNFLLQLCIAGAFGLIVLSQTEERPDSYRDPRARYKLGRASPAHRSGRRAKRGSSQRADHCAARRPNRCHQVSSQRVQFGLLSIVSEVLRNLGHQFVVVGNS
jgi:hypothetical protein